MELALSMWSLHRTARAEGWTALDFLDYCRREGVRRVELLDVFWRDVETELPQVVEFARTHRIRVASYAVANDLVKADPAERYAALRQITDAIPIALALDTRTIRVFSGNLSEGFTFDSALGFIVEGLREAAATAAAEGVTLCLENHGKLAGTGSQVLDILERVGSPALKSTFDTGNFLLVDEEPLQALDILISRVGHVHIKDFAEDPAGRYVSLGGSKFEGTAAGQGQVRLDAIVRRLGESGYSGEYVLEYEGTGNEAEGVRASYAYFHSLVQG